MAAATSASAQNFGATTGFPVGEKSRIHTNLDLAVAFDSNPRRFDDDNIPADGSQLQDWRGLIRPGLLIDVPGNSVKFNFGSHLTISQLFGVGPNIGDTKFGADVTTKLQLGSDASIVSFKLANNLVRTPDYLDTPGTVASDEFRLSEWYDEGTARLTLRPGGRALELDLGYQIHLRAFDDATAIAKSQQHGGLFEARWKFLPKTALIFHADVSRFIPFGDNSSGSSPGTPFRVTIGATGQVTPRITAELTAGYEDTLADQIDVTARGPIGNAILSYAFNEATSLTVGYRRRIHPVVVLQGYSSDMPNVMVKVGVAGRLLFTLYGSYEFRTFSDVNESSAQVAVGDARVEYWFFEWLVASVNYRLMYQSAEQTTPNPEYLLQNFSRHQVFFGTGLRY